MSKRQSQTEKQTIREKYRWKLREPDSGTGGRETQREKERNAEGSRFRVIKSESLENTKQRRVPERARERERREKGVCRKGSRI